MTIEAVVDDPAFTRAFLSWAAARAEALRVHVLGGTYKELEETTGIPWKSLDNAWQRVRKKALELLRKEELI